MSWLTTLGNLFVPEPVQTRASEFEALETQLAAIRAQQAQPRPWRASSVQEALGVPAILSAVSLISNTVGSLSMEAFRNGVLVTDATQVPRLIQRPNPRSTAREFWMKTSFYMATRGEFWWWVAHRDVDGQADALFPVPPWEIVVERNDWDRLNPTIRWMDRVMPNRDMRQQMYLPSSDGVRGVGPLQLAGAAVSVAVESAHWAANFFSGSFPSLIGTTDADYDELDLKALDAQWSEKANNLPRWMTNGLKLSESPFDAQKAQLTESRSFQVGEVARMFGIPGPLLEYQMSGQSLTYRNEADIWTDFQRRCLSPNYLEPTEQEMTDLLTRSTVGRFNLEQLLRADIKTRFEAYKFGTDAGWLQSDEIRKKEGYEPGNVDFAPVPFSPPAADPGPIPFTVRTAAVRCPKCNKLLAESATPPYKMTCSRCKAIAENVSDQRNMSAIDAVDGMKLAISSLTQPPTVNVAPSPIPEIHVAAAEAPVVNVLPDPKFVEAVADLKAMLAAPRLRRVLRNDEGRIIGVEDVV